MKKKEYVSPEMTIVVLKQKRHLLLNSDPDSKYVSTKRDEIPLVNDGGDLE